MRFAGFQKPTDRTRRRRFVFSFGLAGVLYLGIGTAVVLLARGATLQNEERELDVTFRPPPAATVAQPAKVPAPPPPPSRRPARPAGTGKGRGLVAPSAISDRTDEASPGAPLAPVPEDGGGAAPTPVRKPSPPPPPRPPTPPPPPPVPEADEPVTPPSPADGNAAPEYPAAARSKGLEGVVILKIQISKTGEVTRIDVLRGSEPFLAAALAAVRSWRYTPAHRAGKSTSYTRIVKIPFRIRAG
jgi:protein TonB